MTSAFRRRVATGPSEGWLSVLLLSVMALAMALAIDDAAWVHGNSSLTDFLAIATLGGVAAGIVGSKIGWNRWVGHIIGATFAALIVSLLVGGLLRPGAGLTIQFAATADDSVRAWRDLVVLGRPTTPAYGHHLLILGLLCWGTAQFAAAALLRHRQALNAVTAIGLALIVNMAATKHFQLWFLVAFTVSALFLLARSRALDEQAIWMRRRIGDPTDVRRLYLRGGLVFTSVAVFGALTLTAAATWKPLAGAWDGLKPVLLDVGDAIGRFLPTLEDSRGIGGSRFDQQAIIRGSWTFSDGVAVTIERPPGDTYPYYWRIEAFSEFIGAGWQWADSDDTFPLPRDAGKEIFEGSLDRVAAPGTREVTFRVTPKELSNPWVVSPLTPLTVDRPSALLGAGDEAFFQAIQLPDLGSYSVTARVPLIGDAGGGLTQNRLRAAGTAYPTAILSRYTQLTQDAVGPNASLVLESARQRLQAPDTATPFDLAMALQAELGSDRFDYDRSVTDIQAQCGDVSIAECFATYKRGYCQHYATLMAVLLRHEGIPARVVEGYLPGELDENTGIETLVNGSMHMWVEVYFPGIGWYLFDPTGPGVSEAPDLPTGRPVPSASPTRYPSLRPDESDAAGPSHGAGTSPPTPPRGGPGAGGYIVITLVLLMSMAAIAVLAMRRRSRGAITPEGAWAGIARLAGRLGFGPRPSETAFEYASALGEVLPNMRPDLEAVASARVEVAYGGRVLGDERMRAIRDAYAKLRIGLLRLVVRRRERRR